MELLTAKEIIEETVAFYTEDPLRRAVKEDSTTCYYKNVVNENKCAVGRCLNEENTFYNLFLDYNANIVTMEQKMSEQLHIDSLSEEEMNASSGSLDIVLLPQYQGQPLRFWKDLQDLHDLTHYWNSKGLTVPGKEFLEELKLKYA